MAPHAGTQGSGFLSERERKYIDSETVPPRTRYGVDPYTENPGFNDDEKSDLKYRIKENKARQEVFTQEIRHLRHDLERARNFWIGIQHDSEQWNRLYTSIETELKWLESFLSSLKPEPDGNSLESDLAEILVPDAPFLAEFVREGKTKFSAGTVDFDKPVEKFESYEARKDVLMALLEDAGLVEILEHVRRNPGSETGDPLPDRNKTGSDSSWSWWASRNLKNKHGVVKDVSVFSRPSYILTERGMRICEAIDWLKNRREVKKRAQEEKVTKLEAARDLLLE